MGKIIIALIVLGVIGFAYFSQRINPNQETQETTLGEMKTEPISIVAQGLEIPWSTAFLPSGEILVTERPGNLTLVKNDGSTENIATIEEVAHIGEGGLMGVTLDPEFSSNNYLYLYYTYSGNGENTFNRVVRYTYQASSLSDRKILIDQIPGARNHNGGRLAFGPDGYLYVTTGDAAQPSLAQDTTSLAGKILRVNRDGEPAPDNPFGNAVYSYGHRNPQGLAWLNGQLWASEHGPNNQDELNRVEKGQNYGWPVIQGDQNRNSMKSPIIQSGNDTWAPSGLVAKNEILYFAGLRGSTLYSFNPGDSRLQEHFKGQFGRLRGITLGPDGNLYVTTSNRDGRGIPRQGDDKILKINLPLL